MSVDFRDQLERSEASFRALVERLPERVFVVGATESDLTIRYANPAIGELLGCARADELEARSGASHQERA